MEGPSPDIGGRKAKVSPSLTAALQGRPQSFLLPLTPGFHRDQKSGRFGVGGEANSRCWRPRGIMAGPHPRWERERGSRQDHHRGDRRRRFLAGDLWTNMDSGNFEGPVRFEAGPPIWSIRDTRVADGPLFRWQSLDCAPLDHGDEGLGKFYPSSWPRWYVRCGVLHPRARTLATGRAPFPPWGGVCRASGRTSGTARPLVWLNSELVQKPVVSIHLGIWCPSVEHCLRLESRFRTSNSGQADDPNPG